MPCYSHQLTINTTSTLLGIQGVCFYNKIDVACQFIGGESFITRARNRLVHNFLKSGFTHLFFLDADVSGDPTLILDLLKADKPVIGCRYPKKNINWDGVKAQLQKKPDSTARELELAAASYDTDPLYLQGGFQLIKREVFEKLKPVVSSAYEPQEKEVITNFYQTGRVDNIELSEDYYFNHLCREVGIDMTILPAQLNHTGTYTFRGRA